MQSLQEMLKVEAHDSEILCLEYSKPDTGKCKYFPLLGQQNQTLKNTSPFYSSLGYCRLRFKLVLSVVV